MSGTQHPSSAVSLIFSTLVMMSVAICFLCGGLVIGRWSGIRSDVMTIIPEINQPVSTVHIDGIQNGKLIGSVTGNVRLSADGDLIEPNGSGAFVIGDANVLTNVIEIHIPPGMRFVASSKGKKYYPVHSKSGQNLSPSNRIYFPDEQSAEKAGYSR